MMKRKEKSLIRKEASELLKHGKSRQETFDLMVEKYKYTTDVADVMKQLPSSKALAKYGKWNNFLLGIMLFTAAFLLIIVPFGAGFLWYGLLIYFVAMKRFEYYIWIFLFSLVLFIAAFAMVFFGSYESLNLVKITILIILQAPTLFLPFWLEKKLCPKPKEKREMYTDHQGRNKIKIVYEFSDL